MEGSRRVGTPFVPTVFGKEEAFEYVKNGGHKRRAHPIALMLLLRFTPGFQNRFIDGSTFGSQQ
jgi:hypothetical protein